MTQERTDRAPADAGHVRASERPAGMVRVLLPPSPEALVAAECGLDAGDGERPVLGGPAATPMQGGPRFRDALARPQCVLVPEGLVRLACEGPGYEREGDFRYDDYLNTLFKRLDEVITGTLGCKRTGWDNTFFKAAMMTGPLSDSHRVRALPPYNARSTMIDYEGPQGSPSRIRLWLGVRIENVSEPLDNGEDADEHAAPMLRWSIEGLPSDHADPVLPGWPSGSFPLMTGEADGQDVAGILAGVYQAVDMTRTVDAMTREEQRLNDLDIASASGAKEG